MLKLHLHTQQNSPQLTMVQMFNDDHNIYYHMDIKITSELLKQSIITNLSQASFHYLHTEATSSGLWDKVKLHKNRMYYLPMMAPLKYDVVDRAVREFGGVMLQLLVLCVIDHSNTVMPFLLLLF